MIAARVVPVTLLVVLPAVAVSQSGPTCPWDPTHCGVVNGITVGACLVIGATGDMMTQYADSNGTVAITLSTLPSKADPPANISVWPADGITWLGNTFRNVTVPANGTIWEGFIFHANDTLGNVTVNYTVASGGESIPRNLTFEIVMQPITKPTPSDASPSPSHAAHVPAPTLPAALSLVGLAALTLGRRGRRAR
jgi:hypothetical protein